MIKKNVKESLNIVLVLTLLAIISAVLLAVVNKFTAIDKMEVLKDKISVAYNSPITETLDTQLFVNLPDGEILNAFICEDNAVIIHSKSTKSYNAKGIELLVIIKENKIIKINKYFHSETPGLGSKAFEESFLNKFIGIDITLYDKVSVKADGDKVYKLDGVSGATFSSVGVTISINNAIAFYKTL